MAIVGGPNDTAAQIREAAERAARQAAEAARKAALEEQQREANRQRLAALNTDGPLTQTVDTSAFDGVGRPPAQVATDTPHYTTTEAYALYRAGEIAAANAPPAQAAGQPPPQVPVPVDTGSGAAGMVDDWLRAGKASIGVADPGVYDAYMTHNQGSLVQLAEALDPASATDPFAILQGGDPTEHVSAMAAPAMAALQEEHPDASFELLAIERNDPTLQPSGLVIRMTEGDGEPQQFLIDIPRTNYGLGRPPDYVGNHVVEALTQDPALLQQWYESAQPTLEAIDMDDLDPATALGVAIGSGYGPRIFETLQGLPAEAQQEFMQDFAASWLTEWNGSSDQVIVAAETTALANGSFTGAVASTVNLDAVDGLSESTWISPIGTDQADWRQTLEALAANPPATVAELESEIIRLSDGVTQNEIAELTAKDPNALPALLNTLTEHPPISMNGDLQLQFGVEGGNANYYSMSYDSAAGVVVVETSLDRLLGDQADLDTTYGVSDIPMTIRIPYADGASIDWSDPSPDQLAALNQQVESIGSTSLFLHGYQSTRAAWTSDMQQWMDTLPGDTVGIAMAGMGSEGHFLGNGDSPLTARQYAFHTLEAVDRMGLFGGELNVFGHSMGGAATLQFGLAIERLVAEGQPRPQLSYVLAEPAPSGDSVPFLTTNQTALSGTAISVQNWAGTNVLEPVASALGGAIGPWLVGELTGDAPDYVQADNASFAEGAGFEQLKATASGLTGQGEPDPEEVAAFLANNPVLIFAGDDDRIVGTPAVHGIFETNVVDLEGGHYAHLTDPAVIGHLESFFAPPPRATAPSARTRR